MSTLFTIERRIEYGLEIWLVLMDGHTYGTFFSERAAMNKLALIHQKLRYAAYEESKLAI
jgi:hypothetical protein